MVRFLRLASLGCAFALLLSACRKDAIVSYRAPKDAAPALPAPMASSASLPLAWALPKGWTQKPPSEMRVASFAAAGKDGLSADISVVSLSGDAGGILANVNRWRGQLQLPPVREAGLAGCTRRIAPGGRRMVLVDFVTKGLYIDNRYKKRIVAAIYPRGGGTWFFKMAGEDALVAAQKPAFLKFLRSLKFHDGSGA